MITVNGQASKHRPGMTVRQLLEEKSFVFPLLVVRIDGELVARDAYDKTPVPDGAEVQVLHLMSGG
jgi:sulfur carrier protein